ncbi:MAG TPA: hypothetical protein VFR37_03030 [Longimicrobium sp.]|nr:hypothetical protein [Longimicrobium sp.]
MIRFSLPHFAVTAALCAADDARYDLAFHDARGSLRRRVRRAHTPVRVTAEELESSAGRQMVGVPPGMAEGVRRMEEGMRRDLPRDQTFPVHGRLLADPAGWLWAAEHAAPLAPPPRWSVFARGRWMGTVQAPARQMGPGRVLGIAHDELEVPHVRLHRVRKPGEGGRNRP